MTPARSPLFGQGAAALCLALAALYTAAITHGTGDLRAPELLGASFDSLADSMLVGSAEVAPAAIRWEALVVDGRTTMYFGPWPALLRLPLHVLAPSWSGFWSRTSCLLASFLALAGFAWLASSALARNSRMGSGHKRALLIVSLLGFGLGSPLAFLSYTGSIYHESIVWAFAASVWGIAFLWRLLDARLLDADSLPLAPLCGLSVAAGVALLSRVTFGAPLLVVLGLVCGDALLRAARAGRIGALLPRLLLPLFPAAAMLAIQLWYNAARFGSPFAFVRYEYLAYLVDDAASWEIFQRTGPFELQRLLSGFANYFGLSASVFSAEFPWIRLAAPAYPDAPLYPQVFSSYLISLWWVSSWLVLGALAGLSSLFGRAGSLLARACAAAFALELLGVAAFLVLEQRYTTDFLPFLLLAYAFFLRHARGSRIALAGLVAAVTLSCVATVLSTLSAIPLSGPGLPAAYKAMWEERFRSVDRWFGPDPTLSTDPRAVLYDGRGTRLEGTMELDRRRFLRGLGGGAVALATAGWPIAARAVAYPGGSAEAFSAELFRSLSPAQRAEIAFAWDHVDEERGLLRARVSANWQITKHPLDSDFFTADQRALVRSIYEALIDPGWHERYDRHLQDDAGGWGRQQSIGFFGTPEAGPFQFVLTGRHMTLRADGDHAPHMAFGGPIFYGHATGTWWSGSFVERAHHPGNVFFHQAVAATALHDLLDGTQREQALIVRAPKESDIRFSAAGSRRGLSLGDLSADQLEEAERLLGVLVEPFRERDRAEVRAAVAAQGGLAACHLSFFEPWYRGGDGLWDSFRLEGPSLTWHFRGDPHVHVWVHVADDAAVPVNAVAIG